MRKELVLAAAAVLALSSDAAGRPVRSELTLFAGIHRHFAFGSVSEYVPGVNDFPVTPAHTPPMAGLSFALFGKALGLELDARWVFAGPVVLEDPSDGDAVEVLAGPQASLALSLVLRAPAGRIRPYILAGGGANVLLSQDAEVRTTYGFEISLPAPPLRERIDPELHAGGGVLIFLSGRLGLRLEARYVWVLDRPQAVRGVQAAAGLLAAF